jgi:hypothetical protein
MNFYLENKGKDYFGSIDEYCGTLDDAINIVKQKMIDNKGIQYQYVQYNCIKYYDEMDIEKAIENLRPSGHVLIHICKIHSNVPNNNIPIYIEYECTFNSLHLYFTDIFYKKIMSTRTHAYSSMQLAFECTI